MNGQEHAPNRAMVVNTLAVVGFIFLIGASMWLAVYSARFVPGVIGRLGSAAVYLGSVFTPEPEPSLLVIPTPVASTTISFGEEISAPPAKPASVLPKKVAPTAGPKTTNTYQIGGATTTTALPGLPDLIVTINAVGYLTSTSTESFVASTTVPSDGTAAVNFTIKNIGTNVTGSWCFTATIPTSSYYLYQSQPQLNLYPGSYIDYTLGFDQATKGADKIISVTANSVTPSCGHAITESKMDNNGASAKVTILY